MAGSLRRSYIEAENVSYTAKLEAKVKRFCGVVADRCGREGADVPIVDKTGADELKLGFWKIADVLLLVDSEEEA